jgi:hypothetical protein
MPFELGEELTREGLVEHHRMHDSAGWYTHPLHDAEEIDQALMLLRIGHALVSLCKAGGAHSALEEFEDIELTEPARVALEAAAARWAKQSAAA